MPAPSARHDRQADAVDGEAVARRQLARERASSSRSRKPAGARLDLRDLADRFNQPCEHHPRSARRRRAQRARHVVPAARRCAAGGRQPRHAVRPDDVRRHVHLDAIHEPGVPERARAASARPRQRPRSRPQPASARERRRMPTAPPASTISSLAPACAQALARAVERRGRARVVTIMTGPAERREHPRGGRGPQPAVEDHPGQRPRRDRRRAASAADRRPGRCRTRRAIASTSARSRWTQPVRRPRRSAASGRRRRRPPCRPQLSAAFIVTNGRRRAHRGEERRVQPRAPRPPARRRSRRRRARAGAPVPRPLTSGLGSSIAITARRMPAATTRGAHGPGAADVAARLERAVERRAARPRRRRRQRDDLGVRSAGDLVRRRARRPRPRRRRPPRRPSGWDWCVRGRARRARARVRHVASDVASPSTTSPRTARRRTPRARTGSGRRCLRRRRRSGSAASGRGRSRRRCRPWRCHRAW